jgi:hypothetical protein
VLEEVEVLYKRRRRRRWSDPLNRLADSVLKTAYRRASATGPPQPGHAARQSSDQPPSTIRGRAAKFRVGPPTRSRSTPSEAIVERSLSCADCSPSPGRHISLRPGKSIHEQQLCRPGQDKWREAADRGHRLRP